MTLGRLGTPSKMFEAVQDFSDIHCAESWGEWNCQMGVGK
jgi:hypothetical protein